MSLESQLKKEDGVLPYPNQTSLALCQKGVSNLNKIVKKYSMKVNFEALQEQTWL